MHESYQLLCLLLFEPCLKLVGVIQTLCCQLKEARCPSITTLVQTIEHPNNWLMLRRNCVKMSIFSSFESDIPSRFSYYAISIYFVLSRELIKLVKFKTNMIFHVKREFSFALQLIYENHCLLNILHTSYHSRLKCNVFCC